MKYLLFFLIFIGCAPSALAPSERSMTELKQSDIVILISDVSGKDLLNSFSTHLKDNGFIIDKQDNQSMNIITKPKSYKKGLQIDNLVITASININEVIIKGSTGTEFFGFTEVDNSRGESKRGWDRLVDIAKSFKHQKILYKRG